MRQLFGIKIANFVDEFRSASLDRAYSSLTPFYEPFSDSYGRFIL